MFAFFFSVKITSSFWLSNWMSVVSSAWLTLRGVTLDLYVRPTQWWIKRQFCYFTVMSCKEYWLWFISFSVPILCDPINISRILQDVTCCFRIKQELQNGVHSICNCQQNPKSLAWSLHLIPAEGTDDLWLIWSTILLDIRPKGHTQLSPGALHSSGFTVLWN